MELATVIEVSKGVVSAWRYLNPMHYYWRWREAHLLRVLGPAHLKVIHPMRCLATQMATTWDREATAATNLALQVCTECREVMGVHLGLKPNKLHCCLKVMAPKNSPADEDRVATWIRSRPLDARPEEQGDTNAHLVSRNTVWSALLGRDDGVTHWQHFPCFVCNDLPKRLPLFKCDRENWQMYYRSALVFPLRYAKNPEGTEMGHLGFIAFDSPDAGVFRDLPDIFDYREKSGEYQDRLDGSATYHLGAMFADTLGAVLGTPYEIHARARST